MMWGTERMLGRDTLNDDRRMANSSTMGFMKASESGCVLLRANLEELRCALKNRVEVTFTRKAMILIFAVFYFMWHTSTTPITTSRDEVRLLMSASQ
jgi:transcriptional regulator of nitric oxide reductase